MLPAALVAMNVDGRFVSDTETLDAKSRLPSTSSGRWFWDRIGDWSLIERGAADAAVFDRIESDLDAAVPLRPHAAASLRHCGRGRRAARPTRARTHARRPAARRPADPGRHGATHRLALDPRRPLGARRPGTAQRTPRTSNRTVGRSSWAAARCRSERLIDRSGSCTPCSATSTRPNCPSAPVSPSNTVCAADLRRAKRAGTGTDVLRPQWPGRPC